MESVGTMSPKSLKQGDGEGFCFHGLRENTENLFHSFTESPKNTTFKMHFLNLEEVPL